jgi:hypothetical protein
MDCFLMMGPNMKNRKQKLSGIKDAMVDDVRAIRRSLLARNDNDLDKVYQELKRTESEFKDRTGRFSGVGKRLSPRSVVSRWKRAKAG